MTNSPLWVYSVVKIKQTRDILLLLNIWSSNSIIITCEDEIWWGHNEEKVHYLLLFILFCCTVSAADYMTEQFHWYTDNVKKVAVTKKPPPTLHFSINHIVYLLSDFKELRCRTQQVIITHNTRLIFCKKNTGQKTIL